MLTLPKEIKLELFRKILQQPDPFGEYKQDGILSFLNDIWDLYAMPDEDGRFTNAQEDIYQHTVNNDDWTQEQLFLERLRLLESDDKYNRFLETVVAPQHRKSSDEITRFVLLINAYLKPYRYQLSVSAYLPSGQPVYHLTEKTRDDQPHDRRVNTIPFYVMMPTGRSDRSASHGHPATYPAFVLAFNDTWNDYSVRSSFDLFFYPRDNTPMYVGPVKIISDGEETDTYTVIPKEFTELPANFCSMGQTFEYYERLKSILGNELDDILFSFRDLAYNPAAYEHFERNVKLLNSVFRNDSVEQLMRVVRHRLYGFDLANLYTFKYRFKPVFATDGITIDFDFDDKGEMPSRIYAVIGKNGSGKTQLLTSLPRNIARGNDEAFIPRTPFFSKIIAVSYSMFDQFEIPQPSSSFNYVYCGIKNSENQALDAPQLDTRFMQSTERIMRSERINIWRSILRNFIDDDILANFIVADPGRETQRNSYHVNAAGYQSAKRILSSGQSILLSVITEIVAHIRYDSLLLYDEPETHLHPNAITELMNAIYQLVNQFQSYCIIATHSPMIIRELFSKNVYVIERDFDVVSLRRIGLESFGENISTLTEEVFGNKDTAKQYKKIIDELAQNNDQETIIRLLESEGAPLSLNTRLYITSALNRRNA